VSGQTPRIPRRVSGVGAKERNRGISHVVRQQALQPPCVPAMK
jgi:hypothetical protein